MGTCKQDQLYCDGKGKYCHYEDHQYETSKNEMCEDYQVCEDDTENGSITA